LGDTNPQKSQKIINLILIDFAVKSGILYFSFIFVSKNNLSVAVLLLNEEYTKKVVKCLNEKW
jgi:hypothetical protein